jgi:hypothetical protein
LPPEVSAVLIGIENKKVAFSDPGFLQGREAVIYQIMGKALMAMRRADGQMIQVAPSAVVAAKDGPDDRIVRLGHEAHTRVAV